MTIGFKTIPQNLRTPLFFAEIDPSKANTGQATQRTLIIGQMLAAGLAAAAIPSLCAGDVDAKTQAGQGSQLARMEAAYRANDPQGEVWLLPLADDGSAVAATGAIALAGTATAAGVLSAYIAGTLVQVPVAVGATAASVATALAAAITALPDLPASAAAATSTVTVTARNKGLVGNDIDIRLNYRGSAAGEATPAGLTVIVTAMASGAVNPSLTAALAALGDQPFDFVVSPFNDTASLTAITTFMAARWGYSSQVYGMVFGAFSGTYGGQATFGATLNDPRTSILGLFDSPTWRAEAAAAYAGAVAQSIKADPALPLQTVPLVGVLAPPIQSRFTQGQRNALLYDGMSTFTAAQDGSVAIEGAITTYQKNASGQPDDSYLRVVTGYTLMAVIRNLRAVITTKFARVKLADDGTRLQPGSSAVTPNVIRAEIIAAYREMEGDLVEDSTTFAASLVVERDATNRNRVNVLWPGDLINGLEVFAALIQFRN